MLTEDYSDVSKNFAPAELVWHYTGFRGLEGILSGKIWASSASYLNDTQEFRYAIDIALEVLQEESEQTSSSPLKFNSELMRFLQGVDSKQAFVTSFSKKRDDLSQWRAYGGKGPSFAVGFNARALAEKCKGSRFDFVRVVYGESAIREAFQEDLRRVRDGQEQAIKDDPSPTTEEFKLISSLMALGEQAKHESFRDEDEWRLVRRVAAISLEPQLSLKFRESGSLVVPYVEVPLHTPLEKDPVLDRTCPQTVESPIAAVDVGPSPHPDALIHSVMEMSRRKGLKIPVRSSATPFRNW
jgi:hypothetical protein